MDRIKNLNPVWFALFTVWIPHVVSRLAWPEFLKMGIIWFVVIFQLYCLYKGIEILRENKERRQSK